MSLLDEIEFTATHQGLVTDDEWKANLWRVALTVDRHTYTTDYRMGIGLCDFKPITPDRARTLRNQSNSNDVRFNHFGPGRDALATPRAPTLLEVLASLSSDCRLGDQLFEDFCADLGYDTDSRKAHGIWETCQTMRYELRSVFGYARFQEFIDTDWEDIECSSN